MEATPVQAAFTGVNGVAAFGYYVGPYYGTLDRQSVTFYCVDFENDVNFGQRWVANLSRIDNEIGLSDTRFGNREGALQLYQEAAWLTEQYASNPSSIGEIQATIWRLFDVLSPLPESDYWLNRAQATYSTQTYDNFFVVTNVGPLRPTGQVQEFLTVLDPSMAVYQSAPAPILATPEPKLMGSLGLLLICGAAASRRLRRWLS